MNELALVICNNYVNTLCFIFIHYSRAVYYDDVAVADDDIEWFFIMNVPWFYRYYVYSLSFPFWLTIYYECMMIDS